MGDPDLHFRTTGQLAQLIRRRELSPVELIEATLARIERSQPALNAFITVCHEQALAAARAAEEAILRRAPLGALHGIPFSVKDLVDTGEVRTTYGSMIFQDHVPAADAAAVARLKAAGAILIGKTTTPEFGQKGVTDAPLFGRTRNAWHGGRTCGGSSGGAAVAVAAGLGTLAVGTDGGGSTRIPAACNGVVGFKQSLGLVPHDSAEDAFGNISYVTPLARTVEDTALMLEVMAGAHPADPHTQNRPAQDLVEAARGKGDLEGLKIAWRPLLGNKVVAAQVRARCEEALQAFTELRAELVEAPDDFELAEQLWLTLNGAYRFAQFGRHLERHRAVMDPSLVAQLERAAGYSAQELYRGIFMRTRLYRQVQGWFEEADIVATPMLARTALPIDHDFFAAVEIDGRPVDTMRRAWYPYTLPFNLTGNPAISVPCGWDSDGLPVGLQLIGRLGADALLLRAAAAFERSRPWADRTPPLPELD
jgi:aspartyl-tRNA(Asn)/glutamyl-tRNA(Gln) amidotransferase subunit A